MPRLIVEDHSTVRLIRSGLVIELDGRELGRVPFGSRMDFQVTSGRHWMRATVGRAISAPVHFSAMDRETVGFVSRASGALQPTVSLSQTFIRGSGERFGPRPDHRHELRAERSLVPESWPNILGVSETASMEEIRRAYLKLIWRFHPDHLAGLDLEARQSAEDSARRLNIAYDAAKKAHAPATAA